MVELDQLSQINSSAYNINYSVKDIINELNETEIAELFSDILADLLQTGRL